MRTLLLLFLAGSLLQGRIAGASPERVAMPGNGTLLPVRTMALHRPGLRVVTAEEIEKALRQALPGPEIAIQLVDFDRRLTPEGALEFPISGATVPALSNQDKPFLWRGRVISEHRADSSYWIIVRVTGRRRVVRTKVDVAAGQTLEAAQLEQGEEVVCPLIVPKDQDVADYAGFAAKRSLRASTTLDRTMVETPPLVRRGARVEARAIAGNARLVFEAEAHSNGREGQRIELTNVQSKRTFWGKVSSDGSIVIEVAHR